MIQKVLTNRKKSDIIVQMNDTKETNRMTQKYTLLGGLISEMNTTSKKQKFVGIEEFINAKTGEMIPMQVTKVEDRDFNFHKVWLKNLIISLDSVTNKKMELAFWIIEHLNKENQLVMTQRAIARETGISLGTVRETMKALQNGKPAFLVKINSGAYQVNPDVIWKGSHKSRMGIIYDYGSDSKGDNENGETDTTDD